MFRPSHEHPLFVNGRVPSYRLDLRNTSPGTQNPACTQPLESRQQLASATQRFQSYYRRQSFLIQWMTPMRPKRQNQHLRIVGFLLQSQRGFVVQEKHVSRQQIQFTSGVFVKYSTVVYKIRWHSLGLTQFSKRLEFYCFIYTCIQTCLSFCLSF